MASKYKPAIYFNHSEAAHIVGIPVEDVQRLAELDLKPAGGDAGWSTLQVLAIAGKVHTRRAGATSEGSNQVFRTLIGLSYAKLRTIYRNFGRRYLRVIGDQCATYPQIESEAFDPQRLRHISECGLGFVVFDIGRWVERIELGRRELINRHRAELKRAQTA
jgi:hypothetical protein